MEIFYQMKQKLAQAIVWITEMTALLTAVFLAIVVIAFIIILLWTTLFESTLSRQILAGVGALIAWIAAYQWGVDNEKNDLS